MKVFSLCDEDGRDRYTVFLYTCIIEIAFGIHISITGEAIMRFKKKLAIGMLLILAFAMVFISMHGNGVKNNVNKDANAEDLHIPSI
jgi:hypothetical protein